MRSLALGAALVALVGCDASKMIQRMTPADVDARSRAYLALFERGQVDSAEARLLPALETPEGHTEMVKIANVLGGQRFDSTHVVGVQVNTFNGTRHTNLTYELHSPRGWTLANVATVDTADSWVVEGVGATPLASSLESQTALTFRGKSSLHYAWVALAVVCTLLSFGTAIFLATRRGMPMRWLWVLLSLAGIGSFSLNWATGQTRVQPVWLMIGSAGAVRAGPAAPWIITFALPVGALVALDQYRRWRSRPVDAVTG